MSQATRQNYVSPEALPPRPLFKINKYVLGDEQYTLDTVCIKQSTGKKAHIYSAPTGDGEIAQRLRRYVLVLSRYELPEMPKYAKRWAMPVQAVNAASRIAANVLYTHAYNDDPSNDTIETGTLAAVLSNAKPSPQALYKACALMQTSAFDNLIPKITNPAVAKALVDVSLNVHKYLWGYNWAQNLKDINSTQKYKRKWAIDGHRRIAECITQSVDSLVYSQTLANQAKESELKRGAKKLGGKLIPQSTMGLNAEWEPAIVSKPDLEINHTGSMGRRTIATDNGRYPRYIERMVTDPDKRIFSRKTRALGGVVVIDNSGSMSLSEKDLADLMKCSAGSTVVMYSSDSPAVETNIWVIARKGRMVRHIPETCGGNGVDGPALIYATTLRDRRSTPIIWVSDGEVTGQRGANQNALKNDIRRVCREHNIIRVGDVRQAVEKMSKLQGRGK